MAATKAMPHPIPYGSSSGGWGPVPEGEELNRQQQLLLLQLQLFPFAPREGADWGLSQK